MITTPQTPARPHPVVDFGERATARLEALHAPAAAPVWSMTPEELRQALGDLDQVASQVAALRLEVLAEAERSGACVEAGDRSAAEWSGRVTRQRRRHARADLHLAQALDRDYLQVKTAFGAGRVNPDQARVIVTALEALPTSGAEAVSLEQRCSAETFLLDQAKVHDAAALAILGRRLHEVIAPEQAEQREGRILADQERRAARRIWFEMREDPEGTCHGRFRLPALQGAMLEKMLQALMSPDRPTHTPTPESPTGSRPYPARRGEAFAELVESIPADRLPTAAGGDATVVVTLTLDQLLARLDHAGVATLDTGHRISAGQARRLAARHRLIPMVLGSPSVVLDLGRSTRYFTKHQRLALAQTQHGCTTEHCQTPPALCHAHHDQPHSHHGPTDLANGRLLCPHHHRRIHDPTYQTHHLPNGKITFHRRT